MRLEAALGTRAHRARRRTASFFEFWPGWLFYTPVVAHWLALGVRHRGMLLPTAANPRVAAGGLCGETKTELLDQVEGEARAVLMPYAWILTDPTDPVADLAAADAALEAAGIGLPVVAKPDIGCNGTGVRLIEEREDLRRYLALFPRACRLVLQAFAPEEGEAGVFYVREPGAPKGRITSLTLKHAPYVTGDGRSTLRGLILADPRAGRVPHLYLPRLAGQLERVPASGERVRLVFVGNHCKGSVFEDATEQVTGELAASIERIARAIPGFHFGRVDLRFASLAALLRGEGFRIIEINGVGSEATHVWDPRTTLLAAWRAQFEHYGAAFRIGAANRARGHPPTGVAETFRLWRLQRSLMRRYPMND